MLLARSIFITGCSRGIGLELVRQLVPQAEHIIAACRNPENASVIICWKNHKFIFFFPQIHYFLFQELRELAEEHEHIKILPVGQ